jgi:hypothetical protein
MEYNNINNINDISMNKDEFNNFQEGNIQTLNNIQNLQILETNLYDTLKNIELTSEERQQIINRINELLQMRINLYLSLKNTYNNYQQNVNQSKKNLIQQTETIDIIEKELEQSKDRLNLLEKEKTNKIRQVAINTYYGKKFDAKKNIMKSILFLCIPILILSILGNKELIPSALNIFLIGLILIVGFVIIGRQIIDLSNRSKMNFDEYNWKFNIDKEKVVVSDVEPSDPWNQNDSMCLGQECCNEGTIYDTSLNICVPINTCSRTNNI